MSVAKRLADKLKQREQVLDSMQDEIAHFVTNLLSGNVPHAVAEQARYFCLTGRRCAWPRA
ncbi:MAG: hypothetical protein WD070_06020 [Pirellulaceae bacterium]